MTSAEKKFEKLGFNRNDTETDGVRYVRRNPGFNTLYFRKYEGKWVLRTTNSSPLFNQELIEAVLARLKELNAGMEEA